MMEQVKIVVVGDANVGKTCLLISYTTNAFPEEYVPTVFDDYSANVMINGKPVNVGFWDTAAGEDYTRLRPLSYPGTDCFIICYDVSCKKSFDSVTANWLPELNEHCPGAQRMLVGTKSDLRPSKEQILSGGPCFYDHVQTGEGKKLAKAQSMRFEECSAMNQTNLKKAFDTAIILALTGVQANPAGKGKCGLM